MQACLSNTKDIQLSSSQTQQLDWKESLYELRHPKMTVVLRMTVTEMHFISLETG
jgi:hypothetical protein